MFQPQASYRPYYELLVCAERPSKNLPAIDLDFNQHLRAFAFSGLQFLFIERILAKLFGNTPRWRTQLLHFFLSLGLTFLCGLNPTILRAWMSLLVRKVVRFERLNWPAPLTSFVTGVVCLVIKPDWFLSLAFYICWVAALIMQIRSRPMWQRVALVPLALAPFGVALDPQHLMFSFLDALSKPVTVILLFPISLAVGLIPALGRAGNYFWRASFWLFHLIDSNFAVPEAPPASHLAPFLALAYVILLHLALYFRDRADRQNRFWPRERFADEVLGAPV